VSAAPIAVLKTGLVTSVGLSAPATCAALRAKLTNPTETRVIDSDGEWIMAHQVALDQPWRGLTKLVKMTAMAIEEALGDTPKKEWGSIPLLLCVAESARPGRLDGLDDRLLFNIQSELDTQFSVASATIAHGRVSVAVALAQARKLLADGDKSGRVLIAATDSLLTDVTLSHYERVDRILTASNSNGFMPGEGAGALLIGTDDGRSVQLLCTGIGFAREAAHVESGKPLRADGLSHAIKSALTDAGREMHHMDFRITDLSGEHYYFKEASLALSRTLRQLKEEFDLWHPAECTGEQGAVVGIAVIAVADAACRKAYTKGPNILAHMANDAGQRAALSLQFRGLA
jgi:3-oxoacyl-[acyl-carrier-protein] synthase I